MPLILKAAAREVFDDGSFGLVLNCQLDGLCLSDQAADDICFALLKIDPTIRQAETQASSHGPVIRLIPGHQPSPGNLRPFLESAINLHKLMVLHVNGDILLDWQGSYTKVTLNDLGLTR